MNQIYVSWNKNRDYRPYKQENRRNNCEREISNKITIPLCDQNKYRKWDVPVKHFSISIYGVTCILNLTSHIKLWLNLIEDIQRRQNGWKNGQKRIIEQVLNWRPNRKNNKSVTKGDVDGWNTKIDR